MEGGVWIGTSGWSYKGWAETFYPAEWPKSNLLGYYITQFPTVEVNATFYRLPSEAMVQGWHLKAPAAFRFSVKGSRYITHLKKLIDVEEGLNRYFDRIVALRPQAGPVLWQLPPFLQKDMPRLERFLALLPRNYRHAIEFRHPSWIDEEVFDLLRKKKAACVWISSGLMPRNFVTTTDFVYARFHGLAGGAAHDYTDLELAPWAEAFADAAQRGLPCYAYFNNDWNTRAPLNGRKLMEMVGEWAIHPFAQMEEVLRQVAKPRRKRAAKTSVG